MMRLTLCFVLLAGGTAFAQGQAQDAPTGYGTPTDAAPKSQEDVEFKPSADFRVRYQNFRNSTAQENGGALGEGNYATIEGRSKISLNMRKGERLAANITGIHNTIFGQGPSGDVSATDPVTGNANTIPGTFNTNSAENMLTVNRAWGWWKATDMLSFKLGRIGFELADGAVYAENDYEGVPVSHEGLLALWEIDFAKISLFAFKTNEYGLVAPPTPGPGAVSFDPEQNHFGVSFDFKNLPEVLKVANVHVVQVVRDELTVAATPGQPGPFAGTRAAINAQRFGVTLGGDSGPFSYKGTFAYVTGSEKFRAPAQPSVSISQNMLDLLFGFALPEVMGLKTWLTYHRDSGDSDITQGDNETYEGFYYDRHAYAGLMDVLRFGNLSYLGVGGSMVPMQDLEAGIGFYMFTRTESGVNSSFNVPGKDYFITGLDRTSDNLGSEFDLYATHSYESGFKIGARIGFFFPGSALENATAPDGPHNESIAQYWLQASMAF